MEIKIIIRWNDGKAVYVVIRGDENLGEFTDMDKAVGVVLSYRNEGFKKVNIEVEAKIATDFSSLCRDFGSFNNAVNEINDAVANEFMEFYVGLGIK